MSKKSLIQPLRDGDLDIVGDVHGELEALYALMEHLGYNRKGSHPTGRQLVFLGDLTDRGPDSVGVVGLVHNLIDAGRAQCVLGNHDLSILLERKKPENRWFFGRPFVNKAGITIPQRRASGKTRRKIIRFFRTLPLVLERPGLRVVHACWQAEMVDAARAATDVKKLCDSYHDLIKTENKQRKDLDKIDKRLRHQNCNPVKLLTSGIEERIDPEHWSGGKLRSRRRAEWWKNYRDRQICVFGHYSFSSRRLNGADRAICLDYGVGERWKERLTLSIDRPFRHKLAALRLPEMLLVFDDGREISITSQLQNY
jgi:hypothetical protein